MSGSKLWIYGIVITALFGCRDPRSVRAIREGDSAESQAMISAGADVNTSDSTGSTALCVAIDAGDKDTFRKLLKKGASPNLCDDVGTSAIHLAAEQQDIFWLEVVLKNEGNPNLPNTGNSVFPNDTPIFYAIYKQRSENVLLLMAAGADVNHVDGNHNTPLYACMKVGMYDLMMKMIAAGAKPAPPKPAFSIFENGWFTEGYEKFLLEPKMRLQYLELRAMLIEKGYMWDELGMLREKKEDAANTIREK